VALIALAGCAVPRDRAEGPSPSPLEVYRAVLGRNEGLVAVRAVAEVRIAFAGREASLPGVLLLDAYGGFRLELLDPLDRPLAMLFVEEGRIVQYRPAQRLAASLSVLPAGCRSVDPGDWVAAVIASSLAPVAGERLGVRGLWGGERSLERRRDGELRQSVRYRTEEGESRPRLISWYCAEEAVLQLRLSEWLVASGWRLPSRIDVDYPNAGLEVRIELRDVEGNPPPTGQPLRPPIGDDVRWTTWNLPR
jgi:hypothetical protein